MVQHEPIFFDIETTGLNPMVPHWYKNQLEARVTAIAMGRIHGWADASDPDDCDIEVQVWSDSDEYNLLKVVNERFTTAMDNAGHHMDREPFLVGYNSRQYDHPYLGARYARKRLDGELFNHRYKRLDMMREASIPQDHALGPKTFPSQDDYAEYLGIPVDDDTDGSDMPQFYEEGKWDKIRYHCEEDVKVMCRIFMERRESMMQTFYDHYDISAEPNFGPKAEF